MIVPRYYGPAFPLADKESNCVVANPHQGQLGGDKKAVDQHEHNDSEQLQIRRQ